LLVVSDGVALTGGDSAGAVVFSLKRFSPTTRRADESGGERHATDPLLLPFDDDIEISWTSLPKGALSACVLPLDEEAIMLPSGSRCPGWR